MKKCSMIAFHETYHASGLTFVCTYKNVSLVENTVFIGITSDCYFYATVFVIDCKRDANHCDGPNRLSNARTIFFLLLFQIFIPYLPARKCLNRILKIYNE